MTSVNTGFAVAVDGPAGAGKSSTAGLVADALGITKINSGSMFRAVALYMTRHGIDVYNQEAVVAALPNIEIVLKGHQVMLNGEDVTSAIRHEGISRITPVTSAYLPVRKKIAEKQRHYAKTGEMLMEGRDIGYVVLPFAQVKIYLHASAKKRAERRAAQLEEKGETVNLDEIEQDIIDRDLYDQTREHGRLLTIEEAEAHGYIMVDSSDLTLDETVETIVAHINHIRG